tara:strand:- start:272 stop:466 length:195 start_codon:yes stop_codon:yes gene_type:complete
MGMNKIEEVLYEAYNIGKYKEVLSMSKELGKEFPFLEMSDLFEKAFNMVREETINDIKKKTITN